MCQIHDERFQFYDIWYHNTLAVFLNSQMVIYVSVRYKSLRVWKMQEMFSAVSFWLHHSIVIHASVALRLGREYVLYM